MTDIWWHYSHSIHKSHSLNTLATLVPLLKMAVFCKWNKYCFVSWKMSKGACKLLHLVCGKDVDISFSLLCCLSSLALVFSLIPSSSSFYSFPVFLASFFGGLRSYIYLKLLPTFGHSYNDVSSLRFLSCSLVTTLWWKFY